MGSEALPDWALLALEKRTRLLESALRKAQNISIIFFSFDKNSDIANFKLEILILSFFTKFLIFNITEFKYKAEH